MSGHSHISKKKILTQFNVQEEDLKRLCQKMGVKSLAVFGSITIGQFRAGQSDIDFLVEFESLSVDQFFDFLEELKRIFNYDNIDLITIGSLKNKIIREEILSSKEDLYAA